ncbi:MAG: signal peptidase II [Dehalococcoidia bacterium]|nr:signal peptidase II [Dehalococcoidia bacterium]
MQPGQDRKRVGLLLLLTAAVLILDQLSKSWIRANIPPGQSLPEHGCLQLTHITNTGSVFGLLPNQNSVLTVATIIILLLIPLFLRHLFVNYRYTVTGLAIVSLGLVMGGAIGNLIDRLRFHHVTDFIHVRLVNDFFWPAFNVADASIVIGTLILLFSLYRTGLFSRAYDPSRERGD